MGTTCPVPMRETTSTNNSRPSGHRKRVLKSDGVPLSTIYLGERRYQVRRRGKSNGRKKETITRTRAGKIPFVLKRGAAKREGLR